MTDDEAIEYYHAEKIAPLLTPDFLRDLTAIARTYGWSGDYIEVAGFVEWCHDLVKQPRPDLEPFD